jgi:membrane protease YdiL (CAAX protease family)
LTSPSSSSAPVRSGGPGAVYLDYARRGANAWWRYLLTIVLALIVWLVLDVALYLALLFGRLLPSDATAELMKPSHPVVFFIGNGLIFATLVAGFAIAMRLVQGKKPADILGRWRWPMFGTGFGVWTACLAASVLVDFVIRPGGFRWTAGAGTGALALSALFGLGVQTFAEEFVFRGYLTQGLLLATRRPLPASVLSGLLFGALHIPNGAAQCAYATLFGVVASLIAIRTGGIAFTYGLHLINNLFGAVFVVSASDVFNGTPGLFTQSTPNLIWLDLISGVAVLAIPLWFVLRFVRQDTRSGASAAVSG